MQMDIENSSYMDSSLDSIDCNDFRIDFNNLMNDDMEAVEVQGDAAQNHDQIHLSPRKRMNAQGQGSDIPTASSSSKIFPSNTPRLTLNDNSVTNDLFQVTRNNLKSTSPPRKKKKQHDLFSSDDNADIYDDLFSSSDSARLNNSKIEKLVQELGYMEGNQMAYELDDQVRTRIYKGRFRDHHHSTSSDFDNQLNNYLDDNKENQFPYPDPLKSIRNKENNSIKKSGKLSFNKSAPNITPKRRGGASLSSMAASSSVASNQNITKSLIPTLKPLSNIPTNVVNSNYMKEYLNNSFNSNVTNTVSSTTFATPKSPKRICIPNHIKLVNQSLKPAIKYNGSTTNIFLVDSSTGLVNDATQFGTELNASNCEGFPLPEDVNEIVQIPTNDDTNPKKQKMAIIKAFKSKFFQEGSNENASASAAAAAASDTGDSSTTNASRTGFYTNEEFQTFVSKSIQSGVEVVCNGARTNDNGETIGKKNKGKKGNNTNRVTWADQLEW